MALISGVNSGINRTAWTLAVGGINLMTMPKSKVVPRFKPKKGLPLLKKWRAYRNDITQTQLAERSGVSQGMISQLENEETDYTGETLQKLAFGLDCEPADLIMRDPTDTEAPWSIWETLKAPEKKQAIEIMKTLKRVAGS